MTATHPAPAALAAEAELELPASLTFLPGSLPRSVGDVVDHVTGVLTLDEAAVLGLTVIRPTESTRVLAIDPPAACTRFLVVELAHLVGIRTTRPAAAPEQLTLI